MKSTQTNPIACCSFCGKRSTKVAKLIAGPGVYICNECVLLCFDILTKEISDWPKHRRTDTDPLRVTCDMLAAMREADEITTKVFTARLVNAVIREFTSVSKPPDKKKK